MSDRIDLYEALDDLHIEITCSDDGLEWFWRNTDTGQESDWSTETAREALMMAAQDFGLLGDEEDYDNDHMSDVEADADTLRMAGWGTDEDYGCYNDYDHLERDHDEPYEPDTDYQFEGE